jgi:hypothetical protein
MKNLRSILFVVGALLMASVAQAQQAKVTAFVPFDFVIGDRAYSAGQYSLKSGAGSEKLLEISNDRTPGAVMVLSNSCENVQPSQETKLVFRRMGENYFLWQVWVAGHLTGREFPRSQTEIKMAQNHEKVETVIVAANLVK